MESKSTVPQYPSGKSQGRKEGRKEVKKKGHRFRVAGVRFPSFSTHSQCKIKHTACIFILQGLFQFTFSWIEINLWKNTLHHLQKWKNWSVECMYDIAFKNYHVADSWNTYIYHK